MQTFVPYASLYESAAVLDRQRLGKQRVECLQILNTIVTDGGWRNHPAVTMWRGYEGALVRYAMAVCAEWTARGYADTCADKIRRLAIQHTITDQPMPPWWGNTELHRSHRSNLLRKDPDHYAAYFPHDRDDLPYVWPV